MMKRDLSQDIILADGTVIEPIRVETALSRFPIHTLAKADPVSIHLENEGDAIHWQVAPNSTFGAPGPLAYKLDTLVINRRIDEARAFGQAMPQVLRLGSLREIAQELGSETKTNDVKKALLQNASVFIMAKIEYTLKDKTKKHLEANFTRYQVVLTGEDLPGERKADAVYILLNPIFYEIVSSALTRPVDYQYLANLKPLSQRFYELVSPDVYGAVKNNTFTNIRYSDFCLLAPAARHNEQWLMKQQLKNVVAPHLSSGYLQAIHYQPIVDKSGRPDWYISLTPGTLAYGQAEAFNGKRGPRKAITAGDPRQPTLPMPMPPPVRERKTAAPVSDTPETQALIAELKANDLNGADAEHLARTKPEECRRQLNFLPYVAHFTSTKGAYLRRAIEQEYGQPKAYAETQTKAEEAQQRETQTQAFHARKAAYEARVASEAAQGEERFASLKTSDPEAYEMFLAYVEQERTRLTAQHKRTPEKLKTSLLARLDTPEKQRELFPLWQAEREGRTAQLGLKLPADPGDVEKRHIRAATVDEVIAECEIYNGARAGKQAELSALGLLDEWLKHIRREGHKIADPDKAYADFAFKKIYMVN